jgi:hypothetical protein
MNCKEKDGSTSEKISSRNSSSSLSSSPNKMYFGEGEIFVRFGGTILRISFKLCKIGLAIILLHYFLPFLSKKYPNPGLRQVI